MKKWRAEEKQKRRTARDAMFRKGQLRMMVRGMTGTFEDERRRNGGYPGPSELGWLALWKQYHDQGEGNTQDFFDRLLAGEVTPGGLMPGGSMLGGFMPSGNMGGGYTPTAAMGGGYMPTAAIGVGYMPAAATPSGMMLATGVYRAQGYAVPSAGPQLAAYRPGPYGYGSTGPPGRGMRRADIYDDYDESEEDEEEYIARGRRRLKRSDTDPEVQRQSGAGRERRREASADAYGRRGAPQKQSGSTTPVARSGGRAPVASSGASAVTTEMAGMDLGRGKGKSAGTATAPSPASSTGSRVSASRTRTIDTGRKKIPERRPPERAGTDPEARTQVAASLVQARASSVDRNLTLGARAASQPRAAQPASTAPARHPGSQSERVVDTDESRGRALLKAPPEGRSDSMPAASETSSLDTFYSTQSQLWSSDTSSDLQESPIKLNANAIYAAMSQSFKNMIRMGVLPEKYHVLAKWSGRYWSQRIPEIDGWSGTQEALFDHIKALSYDALIFGAGVPTYQGETVEDFEDRLPEVFLHFVRQMALAGIRQAVQRPP